MAEDSVLSWLFLTLIVYYGFFRVIAKAIDESERRKHDHYHKGGSNEW